MGGVVGMSEQYEVRTYPTGEVFLPEGWYSRADLMEIIKGMEGLNARAKAALDAAMLNSKPGKLKDRSRK